MKQQFKKLLCRKLEHRMDFKAAALPLWSVTFLILPEYKGQQ